MQEKILIFGSGKMGDLYHSFFKNKDIDVDIARCEIIDKDQVDYAIDNYRPTTVINLSSKSDSTWCEKNKQEALNFNVLGTNNIAKACDENNVYFVHMSSCTVFNSRGEEDKKNEETRPNPISFYGWTKAWAEEIIPYKKGPMFQYLILRPAKIISSHITSKNMLMKFLTFNHFMDTPHSGVIIDDLLEWTKELVEKKPTGILNVANEGFLSVYDIGLMLKEAILEDLEVNKITRREREELKDYEKRSDAVLDIMRFKNLGFTPKSYRERMKDVIRELDINIGNTDKEKLDHEFRKILGKISLGPKPWQKLIN